MLSVLLLSLVPGASGSIYDMLDSDLLPLNKSTVLLGCVSPNCSKPHGPSGQSDEDVIGRLFDMRVEFIQPMETIMNLTSDEDHLWHHSWQICRPEFSKCRWADVAAGQYDETLLIPAARHVRSLARPIVFAVCNEAMAKDYREAGVGNATDYLAMYSHVRAVFARENVTNVVWSWNTFNRPKVAKGGQPGSKMWDEWYPGDESVDWVGINAFSGGQGENFTSISELYANFYDWVKDKDVLPFFHAFGTAEKPDDTEWKAKWVEELPQLVGPGGMYPKVRAAAWYTGAWNDIQSSPKSASAFARTSHNPVFNAFGRAVGLSEQHSAVRHGR